MKRPVFSPAPLWSALLGLTIAFSFIGCSAVRPAPEGLVATWVGDTLTTPEYEAAWATAEAQASVGLSPDSLHARRLGFLDRYVTFRLKVQAARENGYDQDSSFLAEVDRYRAQTARPYFQDKEILSEILPQLVERRKEEIRVSHLILRVDEDAAPADTLETLERITAIRDSIVRGALDFEEAARRHSEDPSVEQNGGYLGTITGGRTVLAFEDAAYTTPVGEVSEPVRSQHGYHLVRVEERRPTTPEIRASHILIRSDGSPESDSAARATIDSLQARIAAGEDFGALAREHSQDPGSAQNDGDLDFFGRGRMVPEFEKAAFALADSGDVSEPVKTQFGWHLIQLTGRADPKTDEELYSEARSIAQRLPRTNAREQEVIQGMREEAGDTFNEAVLRSALADLPHDSLTLAQALTQDGFGTLADSTLGTADGEPVSLGEFESILSRQRLSPNTTADQIVEIAERFLYEQTISNALRNLEERDPEYARLLARYTDGDLLFRITEDRVWGPAAEDDAALRRIFNRDSTRYQMPERRRVLAFRTPSDEGLQSLRDSLASGMTPGEAMPAFRGSSYALQLDTLYVSSKTDSPVDIVFELTPGEWSEVFAERRGKAVYFLDAIEAPRPKTFEEARAELVSIRQEELQEAWESELWEQYRVQTFPENIPTQPAPAPENAPLTQEIQEVPRSGEAEVE